MAGYDFSASGSNAATVASRSGEGNFTVGGGLKVPEWFMPVAIILAAIAAYLWLKEN
jgi:hypothetical protein